MCATSIDRILRPALARFICQTHWKENSRELPVILHGNMYSLLQNALWIREADGNVVIIWMSRCCKELFALLFALLAS